MASSPSIGRVAFIIGIILFTMVVVFQLVTVPVELDASRRAKLILQNMKYSNSREAAAVNEVLNAAAWTYVAAAISGIATLLYFIFRFVGSSDD